MLESAPCFMENQPYLSRLELEERKATLTDPIQKVEESKASEPPSEKIKTQKQPSGVGWH